MMKHLMLFFLMVLPGYVWAVPITFDELSDGDIDGRQFQLDVGTNTISGRNLTNVLCIFNPFGPDTCINFSEEDNFEVLVPDGLVVEALFQFEFLSGIFITIEGPGVSGSLPNFPGLNLLHPLLLGPTELGAGTYAIAVGGTSSFTQFSFKDYTLQFDVVVPEPSTLALLGIGLVGMGLARRRKKV